MMNETRRISISDTSLTGSGTSTHIYNANGNGLSAILVGDSERQEGIGIVGIRVWIVRIADIRIV